MKKLYPKRKVKLFKWIGVDKFLKRNPKYRAFIGEKELK